jgi:hypothetical protein
MASLAGAAGKAGSGSLEMLIFCRLCKSRQLLYAIQ